MKKAYLFLGIVMVTILAMLSSCSVPKDIAYFQDFNPYGAYEISKMMVEGMKSLSLPIVKYLQSDYHSFSPSNPDDWRTFHWNDAPFVDIVKPDGN